ncbi:MAG: acyl carrier protein [Rhodocyclales bacterium]|nr:acyl carrier protein [Rhodocyclales bacterium]
MNDIESAFLSSATMNGIREFIVKLLLEKGAIPVGVAVDDYRYLDNGHIDSIGFIKFIFRVEEQFRVQFSEADIGGTEIRSVGGLVRLVAAKQAA